MHISEEFSIVLFILSYTIDQLKESNISVRDQTRGRFIYFYKVI